MTYWINATTGKKMTEDELNKIQADAIQEFLNTSGKWESLNICDIWTGTEEDIDNHLNRLRKADGV